MNILKSFCKVGFIRILIRKIFKPSKGPTIKAFDLSFRNPVGLGAGFDKNAKYLDELDLLGFGFVEIGTVTPLGQAGNEKPRLFRLPEDAALLNRMGFNNDGVDIVKLRLIKWRRKHASTDLIIGGNIGKNKVTDNADAWKDYLICFKTLYDVVDYFAVNVSSPNTPGLRALQDKISLSQILLPLIEFRKNQNIKRPILLKISPDLNEEDLTDIIELTKDIQLDGLIVSNTTIVREGLMFDKIVLDKIGSGGISGKPLQRTSNEMLQFIKERSENKFEIIGSGGIFNGEDASTKMQHGASLVQVWTGFIYKGPAIIKTICKSINVLKY